MERRILLVAAASATIALITPSSISCSSVERDDHRCGQYKDGTWAKCDSGRCCSLSTYCGDTYEHCSTGFCEFQCHEVPIPSPPLAADELVAETGGGAGVLVVLTRLVNATYNDNHYLNLNISGGGGGDHDHGKLVKVAADDNASSSSSTSPLSSSFLSCARSLNRLPLASRYKYPFAALRAPQPQNNTAAATRCGRCLKVTNLGVGGVPNKVKVRIAHEHNKEGLELDFNTFKKLDINGSGTATGRILVKYQFDIC
ncbi:unnamed protein product [Linum trigynum]|uniref:Chitin-binding type-1 domain-containing protein n=1 Tax=Linum trigynum TaxID=586398 RepID=A0AAV2DJY0_9ROSI